MAFKLIHEDGRELDLGNPFTLLKSWAELAHLIGDQDGEFPQLLFVPYTDEEPVPSEIWEKMREQAILAVERYGDGLSVHTRWCLEQLAEES